MGESWGDGGVRNMGRREQIEALMIELGPLLNPMGIAAFPSENVWGVQIDEETSVLVDFEEARDRLVLSCEIGVPPSGDRTRLYELMLRHNFHWNVTGGSRMAIDANDGNVVQIFDVPAAGIEVSGLHRVMQNFVDSARAWREIVRQPPGKRDGPITQSFETPMIRA
jgi:hypothetical protein